MISNFSKMQILKKVDKTFGGFITNILPANFKAQTYKGYKKILIVRPGGIGDAILLLPAIKALRGKFHDHEIVVLCEKRNCGVFSLSPDVDRVYLYDNPKEFISCISGRYDIVIDTEQWHRLSAVAAYFTGAHRKIGFFTNERKRLFTETVKYSHNDYEAISFLNLFSAVFDNQSLEFDVDEPFIHLDETFVEDTKKIILRDLDNFVVVFPGASVIQRRWGGWRFGTLAKRLVDRGVNVVILGSDQDTRDSHTIKELCPEAVNLTTKTTLKQSAAILKNSRLLIGADSALMHLAYGLGTKTVSLFGSGIEKKWAPKGKDHYTINKHLKCSPCTTFGYTPECPHKVKCLDSITIAEVEFLAMKVMES
ncbi:MAG: glycosyltransferase family 9 protein [Nitrospirae bacterium]|nr:glycosyltransferase family 9 protein [Nitrospirota bacterium]